MTASSRPAGALTNGEPGEIEWRHEDGSTYVFLSINDIQAEGSIVLVGTDNRTASDFIP